MKHKDVKTTIAKPTYNKTKNLGLKMCSGNLLYFSMSLQMLIACMDVAVALFDV